MANSVDPDETACNKPSHLDLHRLHKYWDEKVKGNGYNFKGGNSL